MRVSALGRAGEVIPLPPEGAHHLCRVLRVAAGEPIKLFDGAGLEAVAVLHIASPTSASAVLREDPVPCRPTHRVHLGLALLKGPAMDDAVRMATEAGLTDLHPILARRSVATGDRADRWERIAASAAQQCGRADVPRMHAPVSLEAALRALAAVPDRRIACPGGSAVPAARSDAAILVGPEGGFTEHEVTAAIDAGFAPVGLGPWILRAATAAPIAVASCVA